jgi:hypothetical protein
MELHNVIEQGEQELPLRFHVNCSTHSTKQFTTSSLFYDSVKDKHLELTLDDQIFCQKVKYM